MAKTFKTAAAFRTSLEHRLKQAAKEQNIPLNAFRLKLVIERLLARLFTRTDPPWLLKGGYAMELRYRPKARTTKDIDLGMTGSPRSPATPANLDAIRDQLQEAADTDLGDYLQFRISNPSTALQGAPLGGARFPCEAVLAGKVYARFHIDIGIGDPVTDPPERLLGQDLLAFAGIGPAVVLAIPKAQQFAEKIHAYTFPWGDRTNTRTKDLIDLLMLIESGPPESERLRRALRETFQARGSHALPENILPPPESWRDEFTTLARQTMLRFNDLTEGFLFLKQCWLDVSAHQHQS